MDAGGEFNGPKVAGDQQGQQLWGGGKLDMNWKEGRQTTTHICF